MSKEEALLVGIAISQYLSGRRDVVFTEREEDILRRVAERLVNGTGPSTIIR